MDDQPREIHEYESGQLQSALDFFKRTRKDLSTLRKCRVWVDRVQVFDVNGEFFEIRGLGYPNDDIVPVLQSINAVYKPDKIHRSVDRSFKEFLTGKRHPWAEDRVM